MQSFIQCFNERFNHSFFHSLVHPFIDSLLHWFIHSIIKCVELLMHPVITSLIHSFIGSLNGSLNHSFTHSLTHSYSCHFISLRFTSFLFNPCHVSFHFHVILHCSLRFISFQVRNGFIQSCMHSFISVISVISFHSAPLHSKNISFHSIPCIHFTSCHFIFLCVARNLSLFLVHRFNSVHSLSFIHAFI